MNSKVLETAKYYNGELLRITTFTQNKKTYYVINEQDYVKQYNDIEVIVESLNTDNGEELTINILRMYVKYVTHDGNIIVGDINVFNVVFNHAINEFILKNRLIPQNETVCPYSQPKKLKLIINKIPFGDDELEEIKSIKMTIVGVTNV